jgi:hypothetical protein
MNMQRQDKTKRTLLNQDVTDQCHAYSRATSTGDRDPMNQLVVLIRRFKGQLYQ